MSERREYPHNPLEGKSYRWKKRAKEHSSGTSMDRMGDKYHCDQNERETPRHRIGSYAIADKSRGRPIKTVWAIKAITDNNQ
jgi:outer membrane cobalamin receptor